MEQSTFHIIARMHSDFDQKFGIPRQTGAGTWLSLWESCQPQG